MRKYRIFLSVILVLFLVSFASAKEIVGAFGIKLGSDFSTIKKYVIRKFGSNSIIPIAYYVRPPKKNKLFDEYVVKVTPLTKKVASIIAIKKTSSNDCEILLKGLSNKLEEKYGLWGTIKATSEGLSYLGKPKNNNNLLGRCIFIECSKGMLILRYSDTYLLLKLEQEIGRVEKNKINEDGL